MMSDRPLETRRADWSQARTATSAVVATAAVTAAMTRIRRLRASAARRLTTRTLTKSANMLDCEYEMKSPAQVSAISGMATASRIRRTHRSATVTEIATARLRP